MDQNWLRGTTPVAVLWPRKTSINDRGCGMSIQNQMNAKSCMECVRWVWCQNWSLLQLLNHGVCKCFVPNNEKQR